MDPNINPIPPDPETPSSVEERIIGYCRTCGKALTEANRHIALGTVFCSEHMPHIQQGPTPEPPSPYAVPSQSPAPEDTGSPALAFILGFIPGVGAIYNGQYAKGLVHVLVFGMLVSILSSHSISNGLEPLFALLLGVFVFYQCFEAYHTAQRRAKGQVVDELSGLVQSNGSTLPVAPFILIGLGVLFLLGNLGLIHFHQIVQYWPVFLIVIGTLMLVNRVKGSGEKP